MNTPPFVLSRRAVRELDRLCLQEYAIPGIVLMENAGRGVADHVMRERRSDLERIVFLCGPGNNGGDAFVAARHLHNRGADVELYATHATSAHGSDAAWARAVVERMGLAPRSIASAAELGLWRERFSGSVLLVDALLGTGAEGAPRGAVLACLQAASAARPRLRIALDLPSGLDVDTGLAHESCFRADLTLTLAASKPGLQASQCGRVEVIDIGAPKELLERLAGT